jgi:hypothetical protein
MCTVNSVSIEMYFSTEQHSTKNPAMHPSAELNTKIGDGSHSVEEHKHVANYRDGNLHPV